mmetsp:Transcript_661/g.2008  ORF Transcript_661/g.2008 Transcript_661/m.2008 type:complete len:235 (+) Transcript_661:842-1546(+)
MTRSMHLTRTDTRRSLSGSQRRTRRTRTKTRTRTRVTFRTDGRAATRSSSARRARSRREAWHAALVRGNRVGERGIVPLAFIGGKLVLDVGVVVVHDAVVLERTRAVGLLAPPLLLLLLLLQAAQRGTEVVLRVLLVLEQGGERLEQRLALLQGGVLDVAKVAKLEILAGELIAVLADREGGASGKPVPLAEKLRRRGGRVGLGVRLGLLVSPPFIKAHGAESLFADLDFLAFL